jgi:hypothetical protein
MPKLRVLREYEVDVPSPGSPEWHKLVSTVLVSTSWDAESAAVNLGTVATWLAYQPGAALIDENVYDPQYYTVELAPTGK